MGENNLAIPNFEVGDLIQGKVVGKEQDGYTIELLTDSRIKGYYPCKVDITSGTRVEVCFVCLDKDKLLLAPKSYLKNRHQLAHPESGSSLKEFSPVGDVTVPKSEEPLDEQPALDFSPPSDFNADLISLLTTWQFITSEQAQGLRDQIKSGSWELVGLLKRLDILTPQELTSIDFGRDLIRREKISWSQFKAAFFDEVSLGISLQDSLTQKSSQS